jgi:hypothetical protein
MEPFMRFAKSGRRYYYLSPEKEPPLLTDLLYGLGGIVRGVGQWSRRYDVLRHSWVCYQHAWNETHNDLFSVAVGYHDICEAVMHDLPSPLKILLADYKVLYARHDEYLTQHLHIPRLAKVDQDTLHLIDKVVGDVEGEMWVKDWEVMPYSDPRDVKTRSTIRGYIQRSMELPEEAVADQLCYELRRYHKLVGITVGV